MVNANRKRKTSTSDIDTLLSELSQYAPPNHINTEKINSLLAAYWEGEKKDDDSEALKKMWNEKIKQNEFIIDQNESERDQIFNTADYWSLLCALWLELRDISLQQKADGVNSNSGPGKSITLEPHVRKKKKSAVEAKKVGKKKESKRPLGRMIFGALLVAGGCALIPLGIGAIIIGLIITVGVGVGITAGVDFLQEKSAPKRPAPKRPASKKTAAEKPAAEKPAAEKTAAEKPSVKQPAVGCNVNTDARDIVKQSRKETAAVLASNPSFFHSTSPTAEDKIIHMYPHPLDRFILFLRNNLTAATEDFLMKYKNILMNKIQGKMDEVNALNDGIAGTGKKGDMNGKDFGADEVQNCVIELSHTHWNTASRRIFSQDNDLQLIEGLVDEKYKKFSKLNEAWCKSCKGHENDPPRPAECVVLDYQLRLLGELQNLYMVDPKQNQRNGMKRY